MTADHHARPSLAENPWFWLMLFGAVGVLGVIVIGPKHAARQARIERMADTRARINAGRELGVPTAEVAKGTGAQESPDGEKPYIEPDFERPPRLNWLLGLLTLLMLVGTAGTIISRRRAALATPPLEVARS